MSKPELGPHCTELTHSGCDKCIFASRAYQPESFEETAWKVVGYAKYQAATEGYYSEDHTEYAVKQLLAAHQATTDQRVAEAVREARIDELSHIRLGYGHFTAETFVNGQSMSIGERIAELTQLRKDQP